MPSDQSLVPDHDKEAQDRRKPTIELHKKPTIAIRQPNLAFDLAPQDHDLVAERHICGKQAALRPESRSQNGQQERERVIII